MYRINSALVLLVVVLPVVGMLTAARWRYVRSRSIAYNVALLAFISYTLVLLNFTLFPIRLGLSTPGLDWPRLLAALVPLRDISSMIANPSPDTTTLWRNIGGNILLFVPFGLLLPVLRSVTWPRMILAGLLVSICIESTQLLLVVFTNSPHVVSSDDVLLNVIGALVGYGIFLAMRRVVEKIHPSITSPLGLRVDHKEYSCNELRKIVESIR